MPPRKRRKDWLQIGTGKGYFHRVHAPLQCLIFITPLLLIYQIGSLVHPWSTDHEAPRHVVAFILMLRFFSLFGAVGNYLPLATVVAILLAWHLARKDKWDVEPKLYLGMAGESILWAIPVFIIGLALFRHLTPALAASAPGAAFPWQEAILSVGAGIYEELLFRLVAITLLNILLVDVLEMDPGSAIPLIILGSALAFASYHFLGDAPLTAGTFFFLTAFGIYAAGIYIFRGFGITVGMHAVYDIILVAFYPQA